MLLLMELPIENPTFHFLNSIGKEKFKRALIAIYQSVAATLLMNSEVVARRKWLSLDEVEEALSCK